MSGEYPGDITNKMIEEASRDDLKELAFLCCKSTKVACKVMFGRRFYREFSPKHDELFEAIDDETVRKLLVTAFRGCGKTTIFTIVTAATRALFGKSHFVLPLGCTATHSEHLSENLKNELLGNRVVSSMFGPIKSSMFSREIWRIKDGAFIMPRSHGQQIRGLIEDIWRPDLVIFDDLEDERYIKNEEHRAEIEDWFWASVLKLFDEGLGGPNWRIMGVGTILHEDCLLTHLAENQDWVHIDLPLCDDSFKSYWPAYMTDDMVMKEVESHRRDHKMHIFYRERMNKPVGAETQRFRSKYFKYYEETEEELNKNIDNEHVVIVDPAKTTKLKSAETGIVGLTLNRKLCRIYVRDCVAEKMEPEEVYRRSFNMCEMINSNTIAVEVTSLHHFIMHPFENEAIKRGLPIDFVELNAVGKKEDRIEALIPYYSQGYMYHHPTACGRLETQLLSFPKSRLWDLMDPLAYIVKLMREYERYFMLQYEGEEEDPKGIEREYKEVMVDDYPDESVEEYGDY